mmetsp:Transcript_21492/g.65674  ORF Transcript_21492/g.65674 Transcript_21492/m.65674 type:complete len:475 (-) Transcript_21492:22-1446(-)
MARSTSESRRLLDSTQNSLPSVSGYDATDNLSTGFGSDDAQLDAYMAFRNAVEYDTGNGRGNPGRKCFGLRSCCGEVSNLIIEFAGVVVSTLVLLNNPKPGPAFLAASVMMCTLGSLSMTVPPPEPMAASGPQPVLNVDKAVLLTPVVPIGLALMGRLNPPRALSKIAVQVAGAFTAAYVARLLGGSLEEPEMVTRVELGPMIVLQAVLNAAVVFFVALSMSETEMWLVMLQEARNFKPVYDLTLTVSLALGLFLCLEVLGFGLSPAVQMAVTLIADPKAFPYPIWEAWAASVAGAVLGAAISAMALLDFKDTRRGFLRGLSSVAPVAVEFLGTAIVVFVRFTSSGYLALGATILALQLSCFRKSGAHFNPVLTIAHVTYKRNNWKVGGFYVALQLLGAVVGAGAARLVLDSESGTDAFVLAPATTTRGIIAASVAEVVAAGILGGLFVNNMMMDSAARGPLYSLAITLASILG